MLINAKIFLPAGVTHHYKEKYLSFILKKKTEIQLCYNQDRLMRLISKMEYLTVTKQTKFIRSG